MSAVYEAIGRFWVGLILRRYRNEIRAAAAVGIAVVAVGAYLATRPDDQEA
jgi:hypothetical protein